MKKIIIKEDDLKIKGFCPECGAIIFIENKFNKVPRETMEENKHYLINIKGINQQKEYDYVKADFVGEFNFCYKCGVSLETYPKKED